jgi:hypothetical protein
MEQVHCSMSFKPLPGLRQLGNGTLWSNGDRDRWFTQVEQSGTFAAVRTRTALVVHVEHEQL